LILHIITLLLTCFHFRSAQEDLIPNINVVYHLLCLIRLIFTIYLTLLSSTVSVEITLPQLNVLVLMIVILFLIVICICYRALWSLLWQTILSLLMTWLSPGHIRQSFRGKNSPHSHLFSSISSVLVAFKFMLRSLVAEASSGYQIILKDQYSQWL
jgi:membrane protein implicated in regulation of membrane protease activity